MSTVGWSLATFDCNKVAHHDALGSMPNRRNGACAHVSLIVHVVLFT